MIGKVDVEMIGPADVRKLYADYGPSMLRKGHNPVKLLAIALDNHAKAWERIEAGKAAAGVNGAEAALAAAIEREKATFAAIVAHVPVSRADASDKVAFLLSQLDDDPYFVFTPDELRTLFQSFATGA
ncbi:MAG: hypothetical protein IPK28_15010 [Devosia sp.]|nr:hypothetical protein [Devosia sp.]